MVMSGYLQLLILLQRENNASQPPVDYPQALIKALDLIHASESASKPLAEIAADLNLSTRYIRQLFARHLGTTPSHYPPSEDFPEFCDRYGIYVECKSAVCFINTHRQKNYAPGASQDDPAHTPQYLGQLSEMTKRFPISSGNSFLEHRQ